MKRRWYLLPVLAVAAALIGLGIAGSGLIPIDARSGHWAATNWLLHFVMRRSVKVQSRHIETPALDSPAMLRLGAVTYHVSCVACHGAPGSPPALAMSQMTPAAPELTKDVDKWQAHHLFWIIRNGIKYTAMPAWPATQDDEAIWAVVAFLQRLSSLDAATYRALIDEDDTQANGAGPVPGPATVSLRTCHQCHGADGGGRDGTAPVLAAQSESYLLASLNAYAEGQRHSGVMQPLAHALDARSRVEMSRYYARLPAIAVRGAETSLTARGAAIAQRGLPQRGVPACEACHVDDADRRAALFPRLDGQNADYLLLQLRRFHNGTRGGTAAENLMRAAVRTLDDQDARALAAYYATRGAQPEVVSPGEARSGP